MRKHILVIVIAILVLALATVAMAADDPFVGTWKLNLTKSKVNLGPPPKSQTITFTAQDNGLKHLGNGIEADGTTGHGEWTAKFDGQDSPFIGSSDADTIAIKRIDASSFSELFKKAGKEVWSARLVVSPDGKTLTRTVKEKNTKGQIVTSTYVFDKQ